MLFNYEKGTPMIYVSTGCVSGETIKERVETLAREGFYNIELTGGTLPYEDYVNDLLKIKKNDSRINYIVHNYFPPPREPFVVNLGSLSKEVINKSIALCKNAIEDAVKLESDRYSFHAGFYFDPNITELGAVLDNRTLADANISQAIFIENVMMLKDYSSKYGVKLFIENNVVNIGSFLSFQKEIPAMLLNFDDYTKLSNEIDFNLLLDVAHLKVSVNSLGLNFKDELSKLMEHSDYLHISDNSSLKDENKEITEGSELFDLLKSIDLTDKLMTLETYEDIEKIRSSYNLIDSLLK